MGFASPNRSRQRASPRAFPSAAPFCSTSILLSIYGLRSPKSTHPISCVSRSFDKRSSISTVVSSRISNIIPIRKIKTHTAESLSILVPIQKRERTKSTSLSMPPNVKKRITAHAKQKGMSFSEFVTILCVNYLDAAGEAESGLGHAVDTEVATKELERDKHSPASDASKPAE